ncbi:MAG: hypothetical protein ACLUVB_05335 [Acutalibacteraceae bacterium]
MRFGRRRNSSHRLRGGAARPEFGYDQNHRVIAFTDGGADDAKAPSPATDEVWGNGWRSALRSWEKDLKPSRGAACLPPELPARRR